MTGIKWFNEWIHFSPAKIDGTLTYLGLLEAVSKSLIGILTYLGLIDALFRSLNGISTYHGLLDAPARFLDSISNDLAKKKSLK